MMRRYYDFGEESQATEIEQAVANYLTEHPPELEPWQMDTARKFVDARIRMAEKHVRAAIARPNWKHLIIAGVIGGVFGAILRRR